jgi:hypothetical protein
VTLPLLAPVALLHDIPAGDGHPALAKGQAGTVTHGEGEFCTVEFCDIEGRTLAVVENFAARDGGLLPLCGMAPTHPPAWLVRDFLALYQAARRFAAACHGRGEGGEGPYPAQRLLDGQLVRLAPTFELLERTRRVPHDEPDQAESLDMLARVVFARARAVERHFESGVGGAPSEMVDLVFAIRAYDKAAQTPAPDPRQTCLGCGKQFDPGQLCTLGGGGPACLPCADRITRDMETTTGPTD